MVEQRRHRGRSEELAGVRRDAARGQHVEPAAAPFLQHVGELRSADQHVGEADAALDVEVLGDLRQTQVAVDESDARTGLGERDREVGRRRRLALARAGARDDEAARPALDVHELQVRAEASERLGSRVAGIGVHDERARSRVGIERDAAEERLVGDLRDVVQRVDARVEHAAEHRDADADREAHERTEREVERYVRTRRGFAGTVAGWIVSIFTRLSGIALGLLEVVHHDIREIRAHGVRDLGGEPGVAVGDRRSG